MLLSAKTPRAVSAFLCVLDSSGWRRFPRHECLMFLNVRSVLLSWLSAHLAPPREPTA